MQAWEIAGYCFDADSWCEGCTRDKHKEKGFLISVDLYGEVDENGISMDALDSAGNPLTPIFAGSDDGRDFICGNCGCNILNPE
jgi:hypothetical protein